MLMLRRITLMLLLSLGVSTLVPATRGQAPIIYVEPQDRTTFIGGSVLFSLTVTGAPPVLYRWFKDGVALPRGTNRILSLTNLSESDAGGYWTLASNAFGVATSRIASLTLTGAPPSIYQQPVDRLLCGSALLLVRSSGSPPFTYQWRRDGQDVPNSTNSNLEVPGHNANLGSYQVVVSNPYGSQTSSVARLTRGPRILQQPANQAARFGGWVQFTTTAEACFPARIQWRHNGVEIPDGTNETHAIPSVEWRHGGEYRAVVTDSYGAMTSAVALLTFLDSPTAAAIAVQPQDHLDATGTNVVFSVVVGGVPSPKLQWFFNGMSLPGATTASLSVLCHPWNQGGYSVIASNEFGSVTSRVATLTLRPTPPVIEPHNQPVSQLVCPNGTNQPLLRVFASRQGLLVNSYQWRRDDVELVGQTNATLFLNRQPANFGDYTVVVSNYFGTVTSVVATVSAGPLILGQPQDRLDVPAGGTASLAAYVQSCVPVQYQWQRNGVDVAGFHSYQLLLSPATVGDNGDYTLIVSSDSGSITSAVARLEVVTRPPEITGPGPEDQDVFAGEWAYFNVSSWDAGAPAATWQWYFNGSPIPEVYFPYYTFIADKPQQQGRYYAVLSNEFGSVTSAVARLKVLFYPPYFDYEPEDIIFHSGEFTTLSAYAAGAPPPVYQWFRDGLPIRNETNDFLDLFVQGTNDLTGYSVVASNLLGSVTSRVATVHVELFPPGIYQQPADRSVRAGDWVSFGAGVTSAPPASYQWFFEGNPMPGETNQHLQFVAGFSRQVGGYFVVASNPVGAATSRVAQLEIELMPPTVTVDPISQSLVEGEVLWLRVMTDVPVEVRWQRDGVDIANATNTMLRFRTTSPEDGGEYQAIVANDQGAATSSVAEVTVRVAGPLDRWNWRSPKPQGNDLSDVTYGGGRFVAVGSRGGVVISTNGTDWSDAHRVGNAESRTAVAYGNNVFVACEDGTLVASPDGIDWHAVNAGFESSFGTGLYTYHVAFGNGRFVARLSDASVVISTNGFAWERVRAAGLVYGGDEISFLNGRFVVPIYSDFNGSLEYGFAWSRDGVSWEIQLFSTVDYVSYLACGEDVCVGFSPFSADWLVFSSNGVDWVEHFLEVPLNMGPRSIAFGNGRYVVAGRPYYDGSGLAVSSNGLEWIEIPGIGTNEFDQIRFENGRFIAMGNRGVLTTSTNGVDWQVASWGSQLNLRSMVRADGLFVAVGNGGAIFTSSDGRVWTARESGVTNNFRSVTWFRDRFVVVGESGDQGVTSTALTSVDGITWESHQTLGDLFSVSHNGHMLVAVGDQGTIVTSPDGAAWNKLPSFVNPETWEGSPTSQDLNAITWTGTRFVAVGKDGVVIISTNGLSWTSSGPGGRKNLHGIAYGDGVYVTVANDGVYYVSTDAAIWWRGEWQTRDLSDVTYGGGRFMAVGDSGVMFTSEDGTNWIRRVTGCGNDLRFVTYSEGSYYAVGNNETILQSDQVDAALRISRLPAVGGVQVEVLGELGRAYRLQGSANLNTWTDLLNFTGGDEATRFPDNSNAGNGWRFYRAVSP